MAGALLLAVVSGVSLVRGASGTNGERTDTGRDVAARRLATSDVEVVRDSGTPRIGDWELTSGVVAHDAARSFWTAVDASSSADTPTDALPFGAAAETFRMRSIDDTFHDVELAVDVIDRGTITAPAETHAWDGVHVLVRYQSPQELYAVSVHRRDGLVTVKKKLPGGPSNGGTYTLLATGHHTVRAGDLERVVVRVEDAPDGAVVLALTIDGVVVVHALDTGQGGPPIRGAGRVALRTDRADVVFRAIDVARLE